MFVEEPVEGAPSGGNGRIGLFAAHAEPADPGLDQDLFAIGQIGIHDAVEHQGRPVRIVGLESGVERRGIGRAGHAEPGAQDLQRGVAGIALHRLAEHGFRAEHVEGQAADRFGTQEFAFRLHDLVEHETVAPAGSGGRRVLVEQHQEARFGCVGGLHGQQRAGGAEDEEDREDDRDDTPFGPGQRQDVEQVQLPSAGRRGHADRAGRRAGGWERASHAPI